MKQLIIAIDFDGTIVEHAFPEIGKEIPDAFRVMKRIKEAGHRLILWTMRSDNRKGDGNVLTEAVDFCSKNDIEFFGVNCNPEQGSWTGSPKAYAHIYIDDAALGIPLITPINKRPYVDWVTVEYMLERQGII